MVSDVDGYPQTLVNPTWEPAPDALSKDLLEGCLSTPGQFGLVRRYLGVLVTW